jgi:uncharacterized protein with ParB-like and HNH nuclease domain
MSQKIDSDKLFVKDVFQKWYRIPEYQRPYVWGSDQVGELLDDVYRARQSKPDAQYFLGSMVLKKSDKEEGTTKYEELDLLDGQQRLTTLFLITAVVRDLSPSTNAPLKKLCQDSIYQMANPYDNIPERSRIVFDIRDKVRDFVKDYIKADGGTLKEDELRIKAQNSDEDISIRNMSDAILTIKDFFQNGISIDEYFTFLRSNVLMIYVAAEELEDAFHLFTVMNNRGIKLRNSDILKAENLSKIQEEKIRTKYAILWENIEEYFAEDFDNFLSHLRTVLVKQKAGYNLLKEYEDNIYAPKEYDRNTKTYKDKPPLLTKGKSTFDFIESYYKHYLALFDVDNYGLTNSFELYNQLTLMRFGFEADYWIAPLLRYYDKYKTNQLLPFLYLLDKKFSSDWIIGLSQTDRIESANAIIKEVESTNDHKSLFASSVFNVQNQDFIRVIAGNIYGRRYARYILLKIDLAFHGHTTKFSPPDTISIEHILPQNPNPKSQWCQDFTDADREKWINRIGNLIFLSRKKNTAQGNLDYAIKKDKYFKGNVELFSNSIRVFQTYQTWNMADLKKNNKEMLVKVLGLYSITLTNDELDKAVN